MPRFNQVIKRFLKEQRILPYSKWLHIEVQHAKDSVRIEETQKIREQISNKGGVYIYKLNGRVLYIGMGSSIVRRVLDHLTASLWPKDAPQKGSGGDKVNGHWPAFFRDKYPGRVTVYWKEIGESKYARLIVELMLECVFEPAFVSFKEERKKQQKHIPSIPDARPSSGRPRCRGRESKFLATPP